MRIAGIVLVVLGVLALVYQGFTYTQTKNDVSIGSLQINHQEHHSVWVPPVVGAVFIVGGLGVMALGSRNP